MNIGTKIYLFYTFLEQIYKLFKYNSNNVTIKLNCYFLPNFGGPYRLGVHRKAVLSTVNLGRLN